MKKYLLFLFAALLPLLASAEKVEIDGIWYNLVSKAKTAEVTFKGDSYDSYDEYSVAITIPAIVTYGGKEYSVTSIGDHAFYSCDNLASITIPESVTEIGSSACQYCYSLSTITIPEGVTKIESETFYGCDNLASITIPESVTEIGAGAFAHCYRLTTITLPEGMAEIGNSAFYNCRNLTSITLPEGVTEIGESAFSGCSNLTSITLPKGVTAIEYGTFCECSSLTTIVLPKSIGLIGGEAFVGCSDLADVYCYARRVPDTDADAFNGSYPEYVTLHVPASAVNSYKSTAPWNTFGTVAIIEDVPLEMCATPTISYANGRVMLTCETEGVEFKTCVVTENDNEYMGAEFNYIPTQTITAYAAKENYEDSDEARVTICWLPCDEDHKENNGILIIPAKPVLIQCCSGMMTLTGLAEGTAVAVYTTTGIAVGIATAVNGTATIATDIEASTTVIVTIAGYSIKVTAK